MDNDIKHVHVGQAIDKRRNELGLSKSELGRKIGVPQQHINRILERETMKRTGLLKSAKHWTSISFPFSVETTSYIGTPCSRFIGWKCK